MFSFVSNIILGLSALLYTHIGYTYIYVYACYIYFNLLKFKFYIIWLALPNWEIFVINWPKKLSRRGETLKQFLFAIFKIKVI